MGLALVALWRLGHVDVETANRTLTGRLSNQYAFILQYIVSFGCRFRE